MGVIFDARARVGGRRGGVAARRGARTGRRDDRDDGSLSLGWVGPVRGEVRDCAIKREKNVRLMDASRTRTR